jgi:hypothetical protein
MLFDLVEILQKRRRLIIAVVCIIFNIWLILFCNQILQTHRADITTRIQNIQNTQALPAYQRNNMNGGSTFAAIDQATGSMEINSLRAVVATSDGIATAQQTTQQAGQATAHASKTAIVSSGRALGAAAIGTVRVAGAVVGFTGKVIAFPFVAIGRGTGLVFGGAYHATSSRLTAVIQPKKDVATPVITPQQAQQVSIIQKDTVEVKPVRPIGSGGACDNGSGNGGYPIEWCSAPMDTIKTISYSGDRINRECTSYAYWYFTTIEGHTDFHVSGNANRWARTSSYPVHATPAVGAIAVETGGYYGHVAIVQALPGEVYDGQIVPAGYVLVSEMNYDWQGHFRYSYSPIGKFSAYIYP